MTWRRWNSSDKKLVTVLTLEEVVRLDLRPCDHCGAPSGGGVSWVQNIKDGDQRVRLSYSKIFHYVIKGDMQAASKKPGTPENPPSFPEVTRCGRYFYVGPTHGG